MKILKYISILVLVATICGCATFGEQTPVACRIRLTSDEVIMGYLTISDNNDAYIVRGKRDYVVRFEEAAYIQIRHIDLKKISRNLRKRINRTNAQNDDS